MELSYKVYTYNNGNNYYYLVLNGRQVGPVYFSKAEILQVIEDLKTGKDWI